MAELRQHRDISEKVFGLVLDNTISKDDVQAEMLVYPYNAALMDLPDSNLAQLMTVYGADAIHAATEAAKTTNGVAPEQYLQELARVYQDFKVVNVMHTQARRIEKNEEIDVEQIRDVIDQRLDSQNVDPVSWSEIGDEFNQEWLWSGWVPHGEVTFIVGVQGAGKSAFALFFADCIANGKPLPDGSHVEKTRGVLWIETEGRQAENVRRARLWGINTNSIYSPSKDLRRVIDLNNPSDKAMMRRHAMSEGVGLVVIDSLGGSLLNENESAAKKVLQELGKMAQETDTTFLIIHHLRKRNQNAKGPERITLEDVRGHSGITQFSPSVIAIDYEGNEMPRFLVPLKMNLVAPPKSLSFSMGVMGLAWNESWNNTIQRAVVGEMVSWLETLLKDGPMTTAKVREKADEKDFDLDLLRRAINYPSISTVEYGGEKCLTTN